ncbi:MAG: tryptophan synthase subunit alpha [Chloroflexota bacterium]|nr:tryptophan synthase subunit alpha [Chloroflexota bacterium]
MSSTTPAASRISDTLGTIRKEGRTALLPFVTAGYPTMETCEATIHAIVGAGADGLEIGIPFSDPIADGPTVQRTSQVSLANGTRLRDCIDLVARVRAGGVTVPIMLMGYFNPVVKYGIDRYVADCTEAGVDGFIIPDLPIEESDWILEPCRKHGRDLIFMVAPTSTERRMELVGERGSGFVYCVSVTGVTGARDTVSSGLAGYLEKLRGYIDLPLIVGFGISTPNHVREVGKHADGVIVASAMLNYLDTLPESEQPQGAAAFVRYLLGQGDLPTTDS